MHQNISRRLSVAPMMDYTDRHARYLLRLISQHTLLYTEMVTSAALVHGDAARLLNYNHEEHPVALQVGGSDPSEMAAAARLAEQYGYDEINVNVGCPSDRVQAGRFGACLMAEPDTVAECVAAMRGATRLPVTVKTRIGIDHQDSYEALCGFVERVSEAGCGSFTIHARKAWLKGLSPRENRDVPPLDYPRVYRLKEDYPALEIIINGGILNLDQAIEQLAQVDGVMVGRAAYHNPWLLAEADTRVFGCPPPAVKPSREGVLAAYREYCERQHAQGVPLAHMTRHLMGLVQGLPGARRFRRTLSEGAHQPQVAPTLIDEAWAVIGQAQAG
ncbi:tRNA dihydrouridine(20/20a) synthase DusA [Acidihalobacter yilgarnensis]|uniref:tRNA-dihydrouridine(20/20a) synthase n=1 Tax=Acidihalobacter yilgarnensis TaxID=2819280 RepID=A0A1D8ISZ5_9GAMM|nr:tRNA dihydrouridine(20/20a) synthase DusA [Acidihalobacter yilgarnensis]AOU99642.1 tRNA dihydrouridine(20/20a) synthase DusA [Acidihalobacter yilgarnensis]